MITGVTCGSFDYHIHEGHILFLENCRAMCDKLTVLIVPNIVIVKNKKRKPYYDQKERAKNVAKTGLVDNCVMLYLDSMNEVVNRVNDMKPCLYILGKDQNGSEFNRVIVHSFFNLDIPTVSTFEPRIESTTRLLDESGILNGLTIK